MNKQSSSRDNPRADLDSLGLLRIPQWDTRIVGHLVTEDALASVPFYPVLDRVLDHVLSRHEINSDRISYVVWGGVAANLLLCILRLCNDYYCFHDVELLLVRNGLVYRCEKLLNALQLALADDDCLRLDVGGDFLSQMAVGTSLQQVQRNRSELRDGDLFLNNVILVTDRTEGSVRFETPVGLMDDLLSESRSLRVRDCADLCSINHIARRIYRTVSKAIRFEQVAQLSLSPGALATLQQLVNEYMVHLQKWERGDKTPEILATSRWLSSFDIDSVNCAQLWLYQQVVTEVSVRTAGLHGISSSDDEGFHRFVLGPRGPFDHHLVNKVGIWLMGKGWSLDAQSQACIVANCSRRYQLYQRPGTEQLGARYRSLRSSRKQNS